MSALSEALGNAGPAYTLTHDGKTYTVRLIDQGVKVAFEKALFERARQAAVSCKDLYSPEAFAARLDQISEAKAVGEYELLSPRGLRLMQTLPGVQLLLSLMLDTDDAIISAIVASQPAEVKSLVKVVLRESFPGLTVGVDADPNAQAPA